VRRALGGTGFGSSAQRQAKLKASDGAAFDAFGDSVAIYGSTAVVGAPVKKSNRGAAYVFVRSGKTWSQQAKLTASHRAVGDDFGFSVAIYGSTVVVGAPAPGRGSSRGAAFVFVRSGTHWSQRAKLIVSHASAFQFFGNSVALYGSTAVVGAPGKNSNRGAAYVFVRSGSAWSRRAELTASHAAVGDEFGYSVALYRSTAVVGARYKDSNKGAAYVFVRSGTAWSRQAKLTASHRAAGDEFGGSVAVYGSTAVVGAHAKNSNKGAAFVFVRSGKTWSQQAKLTASDAAAFDNFGGSVALYGSTAVVGAPGKNSSRGAAYVFAGV
jgi:uncharacterized protein (DUF2345 family)